MKNYLHIILITTLLSGCSLFHTHKIEVVQGNVISQDELSQIHRGMSEEQVKSVMGTPLLVNLFAPNRVDYIYTLQSPYNDRKTERLTCLFRGGRLQEIVTN